MPSFIKNYWRAVITCRSIDFHIGRWVWCLVAFQPFHLEGEFCGHEYRPRSEGLGWAKWARWEGLTLLFIPSENCDATAKLQPDTSFICYEH